jgi:hypothetical protein
MNPEPPNVHTCYNKITQNPLTVQPTVNWPNSPAYQLAIYISQIINYLYLHNIKNMLLLMNNLKTYI